MSKGNTSCAECWGTGFFKGYGAPCSEKAPAVTAEVVGGVDPNREAWAMIGGQRVKVALPAPVVFAPNPPAPPPKTCPNCNGTGTSGYRGNPCRVCGGMSSTVAHKIRIGEHVREKNGADVLVVVSISGNIAAVADPVGIPNVAFLGDLVPDWTDIGSPVGRIPKFVVGDMIQGKMTRKGGAVERVFWKMFASGYEDFGYKLDNGLEIAEEMAEPSNAP